MRRPDVMRRGASIYMKEDGTILAGWPGSGEVEEFDELAKALHHLTLDATDDQVGDVDSGSGWHGLLLDIIVQYEDENFLAETKSFIVRVDSQGFKFDEEFSTAEDAQEAFNGIADDYDDDDDYDASDDGFPDFDEDDIPDYDEE